MNKIETVLKQGLEELKIAHVDLLAGRVSPLYVDKLYETNQKALLDAVVAEVGELEGEREKCNAGVSCPYPHDYLIKRGDIETLINNSTGV